jgi:drug/metabolite transporter (DMT)-like permease
MVAAEEHTTPRVRRDDAAFVSALFVTSTFSGFGAQLCITAALGRASASAVMPVHYTGVFWAVLWGWLLLGETPGAAEACGIAVVALGSAAASAANLAEKKKKPGTES